MVDKLLDLGSPIGHGQFYKLGDGLEGGCTRHGWNGDIRAEAFEVVDRVDDPGIVRDHIFGLVLQEVSNVDGSSAGSSDGRKGIEEPFLERFPFVHVDGAAIECAGPFQGLTSECIENVCHGCGVVPV